MALTKSKQEKLKKLLDQLNTLEKGSSGVSQMDKEADSLASDLIEEEIAAISQKIRGNPTIQAIQRLRDEVTKLKEGVDLKPITDSIKELSKEMQDSEKSLLVEFEKRIKAIPVMPDLTDKIEDIKKEFEFQIKELSNDTFRLDLEAIRVQLQDIVSGNIETTKSIEDNVEAKSKEIQKEIQKVRSDFNTRLSNIGGGSQPIQVNVNSSVASTRYADINFLQGNGIGWKVSQDDVHKRVDIQASIIAATGGGATPAGDDKQIQFNDGGSDLGADVALQWGSSVLSVGQAGSVAGKIALAGGDEEAVTVQASSSAGAWIFTLPTNDGNAGQYLLTDGNGITQWASVTATGGSGITRTVSVLSVSSTLAATANTDYAFFPNVGINLTLPTAIDNKNRYTIKNMVASSILVTAASGQDIDGDETALITDQYESIDLQSNGSVWGVV